MSLIYSKMSLIYSNDMKKNNMKYYNIKLENDMVFYIYDINDPW